MNKQLKMGIAIEKEHKGTIKFIKNYVRAHKAFPSNTKIFTSISKDHLKENPRYYAVLKKAKL